MEKWERVKILVLITVSTAPALALIAYRRGARQVTPQASITTFVIFATFFEENQKVAKNTKKKAPQLECPQRHPSHHPRKLRVQYLGAMYHLAAP